MIMMNLKALVTSIFKKMDVTKIVIVLLVMNLWNLDYYFTILMVEAYDEASTDA